MRVLLVGIGEFFHVGAFFRSALDSLGHECAFVDESKYLKGLYRSTVHKVAYRALGRRPLTYWKFNRDLLETACRFRPDVLLVTKGSFVSPQGLDSIKRETGSLLVNYATDDPFNGVNSSPDLLNGIRHYDLYACTKRAIMADVRKAGCPDVRFVPFGYEPSLHFREPPRSSEERDNYCSDVVFLGNGDLDRYTYFESLVESLPGLRLHLYGDYWGQCSQLRPSSRGKALGRDFRLAVGGARIAPCLVRRANRDGHSMRTFEVPACGGFPIFERTEEHAEFFDEGKEATFFSSPKELADKVRYYLTHESERARLAHAARRRVTAGGNTYLDRLRQILDFVRPSGRRMGADRLAAAQAH